MIRVIRQYHKTLSAVSPNLAANSAFELFKKVRKKAIRDREKPFFERANQYDLEFQGKQIHCYEFGNPENDIVILLHGWDSNSGCMYRFVDPLLEKGKYVLSFNLPGHAFYEDSKTNLHEAKLAFQHFMNSLPKGKNISIVSHSFGSAVTAFGLANMDLKVDELVFLTSPNEMEDIFVEFKNMIGLNDKSFNILKNKANKILGERLEDISVAKKLEAAKFDHLYLFHDQSDKVLPYGNSLAIHDHISDSTLYKYDQIGHYRMLWNEDLVNEVISVLK
ncbi:hypothetical protein KFE94_08225 [bacterium SCSIO 12643]|nr:hypothetical protein KFE94_08225 [bacterium SCSIO 12643]